LSGECFLSQNRKSGFSFQNGAHPFLRIEGYDLRIAGTAAVIGMAKSRGLIASAREEFPHYDQSNFRILAKVINTGLLRVGESGKRDRN